MRAVHDLIDLLVPLRCGGCDAPVRAAAFCATCAARAEALRLPLAVVPLASDVGAVGAYAYDGVVAGALRAVKVHGRHALLPHLGDLLRSCVPLPDVAVTWVPAHPAATRERGFDHARLLAGQGAVPLLRRTRRTRDQTALDPRARRANQDGAFAALGAVPPAVVLVDDVRTTGATARAAAGALRSAGARRVLVATLAVGGDLARDAARHGPETQQ